MFFQFAIAASALAVTIMPSRLLRARYPLAIMFAIATAIIMVSSLLPKVLHQCSFSFTSLSTLY